MSQMSLNQKKKKKRSKKGMKIRFAWKPNKIQRVMPRNTESLPFLFLFFSNDGSPPAGKPGT
jgi:hypothetical protein